MHLPARDDSNINSSTDAQSQENPDCWEASVEPEHDTGLDYNVSLSNGASAEGPLKNVSDRAACLQVCCARIDCDLAIVGTPQDGPAQCYIISCVKDGKDVCTMREMMDFTAYRKRQTTYPKLADDDADPCTAPKDVGPCRASMTRYYYDTTNHTCQKFMYGGCKGNRNNFESMDKCNTACDGASDTELSNETPSGTISKRMALAGVNAGPPDSPVSTDFAEQCQAQAKTGPCRASIPRYFYNHTSGACQRFTYGGCRGNRNNYASAEECLTTCTVTVLPSGRKAPEVNPAEGTSAPLSESCTAERSTGPCRGAFPSFHFDPATQSCLPFIYGGCQGNENRYDTAEECLSHCTGTEGKVDEHGQHPNRWTPAFFLVATLAIMAAVVLVGLLLISLRRVKNRRRVREDKEELLPEDQLATEQST
ncbi:hypothetical protein AAFF_G00037630 [Aldrovandia affinis]|uniref:Uncharacterized protein n=1 Tax=Aldrovandia affinis TaxID=143900 RepID=A0AAD7T6R2_9TELE|nr:hypothetical protein AAFF_G00037630 [Aldrovandia affinis]